MTNRSADVMKMLKEIAEKEVETATVNLAAAMKKADEAQAKYDMLVNYRQEYSQNLSKSLEKGLDAQAYLNFQNFFKKLDQAVAGQLQVVESAQRFVLVQKKSWKEAQRKKLSYEVLGQRHADQALEVANKKEQKQMDEFSMRATSRKPK